jgi:homocysteine S-methyltransferase
MDFPDRTALSGGIVVLDGGLATTLQAAGHDVSSALWSAALLRDDPAAIVAAHEAFFAAGAQVATSASYQASFEGLAAEGAGRAEAEQLMHRSVGLARQAQSAAAGPAPTWVAASVGPYGAMLADGSEYTGGYAGIGVTALREFHRPRLEALAAAAPDVLACETVPCLAEAEALLIELGLLGVPAWLSLTTVTGADGVVRTRRGERAAEAFAMAAEVEAVVAVGVNCVDPRDATAAVRCAVQATGGAVLVIAYPNSGETWDAVGRRWRGESGLDRGQPAEWVAAGARLVGGCCRVGPRRLAALVEGLSASGLRPAREGS